MANDKPSSAKVDIERLKDEAMAELLEDFRGTSRSLKIRRRGVAFGNDQPFTQKNLEALMTLADLKPKEVVKTRRVKVIERVEVSEREYAQREAMAALPKNMQVLMKAIMDDPQLNEGVGWLMGRSREMRHPVTAMLAGVALHPPSRRWAEDWLDDVWATVDRPTKYDEVVIGSGIHAAIYCAVRVKMGFPRPLVIEQNERAGGTFAMTKNPAFYLNSRNRRGELSVPGDLDGALNVLPGSMIQPSDLSGEEYMTNDQVAFAIRMTLAMNADVMTGSRVERIFSDSVYGSPYKWRIGQIRTKRIIFATGLGVENRFFQSPHLLTFSEFMKMMDSPFPLRGMRRVAVIGRGDSSKTAIESLVGQGPQPGMSVASLDRPELIDWYGPGVGMSCDLWQAQNRTRYKAIGKLFPDAVKPFALANIVTAGYNSVVIDGTPYDHVIDCRGSSVGAIVGTPPCGDIEYDVTAKKVLGYRDSVSRLALKIGAALYLPGGEDEMKFLNAIGENSTSIFRYAGRTAQLAAQVPAA